MKTANSPSKKKTTAPIQETSKPLFQTEFKNKNPITYLQETNNNQAEKLNEEESKEDNTSSVTVNFNEDDEYFANSKLEREKMYSQMLENYQKISLKNS